MSSIEEKEKRIQRRQYLEKDKAEYKKKKEKIDE